MLMIKTLVSVVYDNLVEMVRESKRASVDLAKIESAVGYVQGVKKTRMVAMGVAGMLLAVVFAGTGFILLHLAFLYYVPWDAETKAKAVAILGAIYFFVPVGIVIYFLTEKKWLQFSKSNELIDKVIR